MSRRAIDVSNFQGYLTRDQVQGWVVDHLIVRASLERPAFRDIAQQQLGMARECGLSVSVYVWCYFNCTDPAETIADALATYGAFQPTCWWLDCEDVDGNSYHVPAQNIAWTEAAVAALVAAGQQPAIYSGAWWWNDPRYMAGSTAFRHLPLWCAQYDDVPDLAVWTPFGGWQACAAKQWSTGGGLDRDVVADWVTEEHEDVDRIAALESQLGYLQGDVADALEVATATIEQAHTLKAAKAAARDGLRPALATLRRGGAPPDAET